MLIQMNQNIIDVVAKSKLGNTKQTEAVRELQFRTAGVPYQTGTKRVGGFFSGIKGSNQAKQVTELLKRFIA